jgi:glycerophosphoryl diester phosphodiesterase
MNKPDNPGREIALLAHRGYAARYPENTREALGAAVAAGARNLEFDIQLSADKVPFLLHDKDFRRTAHLDATVFELDAEAVASIDVHEPTRFGDEFLGVRAPRLADIVADLAGWPGVTAFVELKRQSIDHFGLDVALDAVLPVLQPVLDQCVLISFRLDAVLAARERCGCRIGWALRSWSEENLRLAAELAPEYLFCNIDKLPPGSEPLRAGSWIWVVYEIADPVEVQPLVARGVEMIETMAYAELAAAADLRVTE